MSDTYDVDMSCYPVVFAERSDFADVYGGAGELVVLEAYRYTPNRSSDTVLVFMHPIGGGAYLPMVRALARAGHHVIYCNSRYRGVDSALIMEKVAADLGACIRHATETLGYERVVLGGWSGGGSLSLFYQQQATQPQLTTTPAGDPYDLAGTDLIPAAGVMLLAAHISRHGTLTEWMDPSIIDEFGDPHDAKNHVVELNLYDADNPNQPRYGSDFLHEYAAAQVTRNRRITTWVQEQLQQIRAGANPHEERGFVVHGTMADPRWLDPSVDPNDRQPGVCYLGDPRVVNHGPVGLARFSTLRSWMSQWSYDHARADGVVAAAAINVPVLVIDNSADNACTPSHAQRMFDAVAHDDKVKHTIVGANHYYLGADQAPHLAEAVTHCSRWLDAHGFV